MTGVISGGWEYVWLAYAVTSVAFIGYGVMLIARVRKLERESGMEGDIE